MYHALHFFTVYFHSVISLCAFLLYRLHSKADAVNQTFLCVCKRLTIDQSNVENATPENEEQYPLSNMIYEVHFDPWAPLDVEK